MFEQEVKIAEQMNQEILGAKGDIADWLNDNPELAYVDGEVEDYLSDTINTVIPVSEYKQVQWAGIILAYDPNIAHHISGMVEENFRIQTAMYWVVYLFLREQFSKFVELWKEQQLRA